jgi:hypothetical protein
LAFFLEIGDFGENLLLFLKDSSSISEVRIVLIFLEGLGRCLE